MRARYLFTSFFVFRLLLSFQVRTFFQPDEFYQSLEPAHNLVFGYGYLTWEYIHGIRGISHPLMYALPYKVLHLLGIDSRSTVNAVPKVVGALQAAFADYYTVAFIRKYWTTTGSWSIVVTLFSAWNAFAMTRSFSNSLETALTAYALYKWPFNDFGPLTSDEVFSQYLDCTIKALSAIGFAFLVRPTAILPWIVPALHQLSLHRTTFLFEAVFVAYVALQYSVIIDSFYFGSITLSLWRFLKFNGSGSADFYGVSDWHYYLVQGLPLLLTGYMPFFLHGLMQETKHRRSFTQVILFVLVCYSILGHKEVRFLMPLLPILHGFVASSMANFAPRRSHLRKAVIVLILSLNMGIACYGTQVHQRGVMELMDYVAQHREITELTLLMPCHSTPWSANLHKRGNYRFLTCEPPLGLSRSEKEVYRDEADRFYDDPVGFMLNDKEANGLAEFVAIFEASQQVVESFWTSQGIIFKEERRWFNTHFHDDYRRRGDVILYKL